MSIAKQIGKSAQAFESIVWPAIRDCCGGGQLESVEGVTVTAFAKTLDMLSGIDAWQVIKGVGIRGIASRVQWGDKDWATFTVRKTLTSGYKTEWCKIEEARRREGKGLIRPQLVVQAYITKDEPQRLIAAYVISAPDLHNLCRDELEGRAWYLQTNPSDGNTFAVFTVKNLIAEGIHVAKIGGKE